MSIRITKIREALGSRNKTTEAWRNQRDRFKVLTQAELDAAEEFERMSKRRPEVLKMILCERARREGWKRGAFPPPEMEAHL